MRICMVSMSERDKLWEKVKKDLPCDPDPALQEVHYARLKIHEPTEGLSDHEFVKYIRIR